MEKEKGFSRSPKRNRLEGQVTAERGFLQEKKSPLRTPPKETALGEPLFCRQARQKQLAAGTARRKLLFVCTADRQEAAALILVSCRKFLIFGPRCRIIINRRLAL